MGGLTLERLCLGMRLEPRQSVQTCTCKHVGLLGLLSAAGSFMHRPADGIPQPPQGNSAGGLPGQGPAFHTFSLETAVLGRIDAASTPLQPPPEPRHYISDTLLIFSLFKYLLRPHSPSSQPL